MPARQHATSPKTKPRPSRPHGQAGRSRPARAPLAVAPVALRADSRAAIEGTVTGLGYELVDVERAARGLLRITIDRLPDRSYPSGPGEFVTVDDCEAVTRQLQYALEVDGVAYERLEVSSPGVDRPLRTEAHLLRFLGAQVSLTLKLPFQGRKAWKGVLAQVEQGFTLTFDEGQGEQVLGFALDEVREARLVPELDFKGRKAKQVPPPAGGAQDGGQDR